MPIQILPDEVASQIAAGEVVERPASVVKELVENALDAGADHITITVDGAGQQLIEVADNGGGIPAGQLAIALARHATSKLQLGGGPLQYPHPRLPRRGPGLDRLGLPLHDHLPPHARRRPALVCTVEGGVMQGDPAPIGAPAGTVVRVEDLFYNVPARRKFLKTDNTERRQIDDFVTRYALAYPRGALPAHPGGPHRLCRPPAVETGARCWLLSSMPTSPVRCWRSTPSMTITASLALSRRSA